MFFQKYIRKFDSILMQNDTVVGFLADALSCVVTGERRRGASVLESADSQ